MNVYHNENFWGKGRHKKKLTAFSAGCSFSWCGQQLLIPAVYTGGEGAVLDICARVPAQDMAAYLKKWNRKRRMALKTRQDPEQFQSENPISGDFAVEMSLDQTALIRRMSCSLAWYTPDILQMEDDNPFSAENPQNEKDAEKLMQAYGCDRDSCWHFGRISYDWKEQPVLSPQEACLSFHAKPVPVTASCFTADASCKGRTIQFSSPADGQEYTLALHGCELKRFDLSGIGAKDVIYPEYCQLLSYSITPEIDSSLFRICDCAQGDHPQKADSLEKKNCPDGPCACSVMLAGDSGIPGTHTAASSMYFEPVTQIQWRTVFEVKQKEDLEVRLLLSTP